MYYEGKIQRGKECMKPRIFVSSTFYDLRSIREDISLFIKQFGFDPILSENGDIGYVPWEALDSSCYAAMKECDVAILVIGSRYGSRKTVETEEQFGKYISVTREEFRTAVECGIPVYAFVYKEVLIEYGVYKNNINNSQAKQIKYRATEDINIFRFIDEVYKLTSITVTAFDKTQEIKDFLQIQWAALFKKYVNGLRDDRRISSIENAMSDMKDLIKKMDLMVNTIGRKVLEEEPEAYNDVVKNQNIQVLCDKIMNCFRLSNIPIEEDERKKYLIGFLDHLVEIYDDGKWYDGKPDPTDEGKASRFHNLLSNYKYWVVEYVYSFNTAIKELKSNMSKEESRKQIIDYMEQEDWFIKMKRNIFDKEQ